VLQKVLNGTLRALLLLDIQTAVAFLSTRVKESDRDDQKQLGRCLKYLKASKDLTLTLETDDPLVIKWFV
jgi:hypothetical protein